MGQHSNSVTFKAKKGISKSKLQQRIDKGVEEINKGQAEEIDLGFGLSDMGFSETECAQILEMAKQKDRSMVKIEMPRERISLNKAGKIVLTLLILGVSVLLIWGVLWLINIL